MAEEIKSEVQKNKLAKPAGVKPGDISTPIEEHYEEVSEYRIGEGAPPLFLVLAFVFIVLWAMFSWIPFFHY
jgi:hypothetical protein